MQASRQDEFHWIPQHQSSCPHLSASSVSSSQTCCLIRGSIILRSALVTFDELTKSTLSIASSTLSAQLEALVDVVSIDIMRHLFEKSSRRLRILLGPS